MAGDFNNDGKMDYAVGNTGRNSFYRASPQYPVRIYAKDFDSNGIYDFIPSVYLPDQEGNLKEFPVPTRDELLGQMNSWRKKFPTYKSYAVATMDDVLSPSNRKDALILEANNLQSCLLTNNGQGKFSSMPLPAQAQISMMDAMVAEDFNGDGYTDLLMNGNDFGTDVSIGRYDAFNGLLMLGGPDAGFQPQSILQSGIFIPGNAKAMVKLRGSNGNFLIAISQNRGPIKIFELRAKNRTIPLEPMDVKAEIKYKNGKTVVQEAYYGSSFLSQSGRFLLLSDSVSSVKITNNMGKSRMVNL